MKTRIIPILIFGLFGCSTNYQLRQAARNKVSPDDEAKAYIAQMNIPAKGFSCAQADSDNDGYVSCDLNLGDGKFEQIQCGAIGAVAYQGGNGDGCNGTYAPITGCKRAKANVIIQDRSVQ